MGSRYTEFYQKENIFNNLGFNNLMFLLFSNSLASLT